MSNILGGILTPEEEEAWKQLEEEINKANFVQPVSIWPYEAIPQLMPINGSNPNPIKCECGAEKTYGPDTPGHATWCPKWRKP